MKIYKVVLDNEETRFFLTESDIRGYLENNKFLYLIKSKIVLGYKCLLCMDWYKIIT